MTPKPPGSQGIPESVRRSIAEAEEVMASGSPMVTLDEVLTAGDAATFSFAGCRTCNDTGIVTSPDPVDGSPYDSACPEPGCVTPYPVAADFTDTGEEPF